MDLVASFGLAARYPQTWAVPAIGLCTVNLPVAELSPRANLHLSYAWDRIPDKPWCDSPVHFGFVILD